MFRRITGYADFKTTVHLLVESVFEICFGKVEKFDVEIRIFPGEGKKTPPLGSKRFNFQIWRSLQIS